jgi:uncharacterized protein YndB with AHSA1/START domain
MDTLKRFIYVDAPPKVVNEIGLRTDLLPEWFEGVTDARPEEDFPAEGSSMVVTMRLMGFSFDVTQTVEEYTPGEKLVLRIQDDNDRVNARTTWYYNEEDGRSKVRLHYDYEIPNAGGFGSVVKPIVKKATVENVEKSLRNLKLLVERMYDGQVQQSA